MGIKPPYFPRDLRGMMAGVKGRNWRNAAFPSHQPGPIVI